MTHTPRGGRAWIPLAALLGLVLLSWLPRLRGPIDLHFDGSIYYVLGTALAEGRGYRLLNEPGAIEAVQYPPLLPALVALHQRLLGTSDPLVVGPALRLSFCGLSLALAAAVHALARRHLAQPHAFLAALVAVLGFRTLYLSDLLFAELPFALAAALFVLAAQARTRWSTAASALAGAGAFLLRSAGIALLAAWVAEAFLERRWRAALVRALLAAAPVLAWRAYVQGVRSAPEFSQPAYEYQRADYQHANVSYVENAALEDTFRPELGRAGAREVARRFLHNASFLPLVLGESVSTSVYFLEDLYATVNARLGLYLCPPWIARPALVSLTLLALAGLVCLWRDGRRLVPLCVAAGLALVCLTPWPQQWWRYLQPLAFLVALGLARGLAALAAAWNARAARAGLACAWCGILAALAWGDVKLFRARSWSELHSSTGASARVELFFQEPEWKAYERALGWLVVHTPSDAILATSAPHYAFVNTARRAVFPPFEADPREAQRLLDGVPVDYLILDGLWFLDVSQRYAEPVVRANPGSWERVHSEPEAGLEVWRRSGSPGAAR